MIKKFITRNIFDPLHRGVYRGDKCREIYREYERRQWESLEANRDFQRKKLHALVSYAITRVPYYKGIAEKANIRISEKSIFEDVKRFPILTKEILKKEFNRIYVPIKGKKAYSNSSGGSTGEPIRFMQDFEFESHIEAVTRLQYSWAQYEYGDTMIKLWGSLRDISAEHGETKHDFAQWMRSVYILNSFCMDEATLAKYVAFINKKKPRLILAYVNSINDLADYLTKTNTTISTPKAIMTSAGVLYPHMRRKLERVFKCPIYNRYGSREAGNIASDCEKHEGLHVSTFTHHVEILDKDMNPCKEGEMGDIYITLLDNFTMPLIRYRIGDTGRYTSRKCTCGRGLPLIKEIVGRDMEWFRAKNGTHVQGEFFIHALGVYFENNGIGKFQVIQKKEDLIEIRAIINNQEQFDNERIKMEKHIRKAMGQECRINWKKVGSIPLSRSGKYMYTIREFR